MGLNVRDQFFCREGEAFKTSRGRQGREELKRVIAGLQKDRYRGTDVTKEGLSPIGKFRS